MRSNLKKLSAALILALAGSGGYMYTHRAQEPVLGASIEKAPTSTGLVGYWSFNDGTGTKATDFSGNGNTGTLTNGPSWAGGKLGYGLSFDGTNDYVDAGAPSSLAVTSAFSLSAWVKPAALSGRKGIVSKVATGSDYIIIETNGATFRVLAGNISGTSTALSSGAIDTNWHHVVFIYDGTTSSLYVDGTFVTSAVVNLSPYGWNTAGTWKIGDNENGFVNYFSGSIDEVRIYNRALSANEVTALYNTGAAKVKAANNNGLVGYWSLDDGTGTKATDFSGNGNTGTLTNGPTWGAGKLGYGINFDGTNDSIDLGTGASLDVAGGNSTISVWAKWTTATGNTRNIVQLGANTARFQIATGFNAGGQDKLSIVYGNGTGLITDLYDVGSGLNNGAWHHLLVTKTSGGTVAVYIDGVVTATPNSGVANISTSNSIGSGVYGAFSGSIDEVRLYNRVLSAQEILSLYQAGLAKINAPNNNGLVGYWSMNDGSGTKATDFSGNGNVGTLTNGPTWGAGRSSYGLRFDGTDDYVALSTQPPRITSDWSASAWIYSDSFKATGGYAISTTAGGADGDWYLGAYNGALAFYGWLDGGAGDVGKLGPTMSTGRWYHVVWTWRRSGSVVNLYVDGVARSLVDTSNSGAGVTQNDIGRVYTSSAYYFRGSIDDVRIYNRALGAAEVLQLYQSY